MRPSAGPTLSSLPVRILGALFGLAISLLTVFVFTTFALVAGVLALAGLARLWWLQQPAGPDRVDTIDAEYTVTTKSDPKVHEPDAILPPRARDGR